MQRRTAGILVGAGMLVILAAAAVAVRHGRMQSRWFGARDVAAVPEDWLWQQQVTVKTELWELRGEGLPSAAIPSGTALRAAGGKLASVELPRLVRLRGCPQPRRFSFLEHGRLHVNCSKDGKWAAWPDHAAPGGGVRWQPLPPGPQPWSVAAEVVVTMCDDERNWHSQVIPRATAAGTAAPAAGRAIAAAARVNPAAGSRKVTDGRRLSRRSATLASHTWTSSTRRRRRPQDPPQAPSVLVLYLSGVSRPSFVSSFEHSAATLRRLNRSGATALFNFPLYHGLPCCGKNWLYAAMSGHYSPSPATRADPAAAATTPWLWSEYARAGYATHVSADACHPPALRDWWRSEATPLPPNISDHPLIDAFCKLAPTDPPGGPAHFESRWPGASAATNLDNGASVCLAGETAARRWLRHALDFMRSPGYASRPKFGLVALGTRSCRCQSGA